MDKTSKLKEKYQASDFHWLILIFVCLFVMLVMLSLLLAKDDSSINSRNTSTTLQEQEEKEEEFKSAFGDIGTPANTKNFEFIVNKVDCTQISLERDPDNQRLAKIVSKKGKFCLVGLTVKNISDETQSFASEQVLLSTYESSDWRWQSMDVQYRSNAELEGLLRRNQYSDIKPEGTAEGQLIFDIPAEDTPYRVDIIDNPIDVPARIYLDDYSNDYGFECRNPQSVVLSQIFSDCAYEYTFESLTCEQTFVINDQTGKVCLADFAIKNISNQYREGSPYAPNITYARVHSSFWNHAPYLVDKEGNRYSQSRGVYIGYDEETDEYKRIEIPEETKYIDGVKDIAPSQSLNDLIIFILPTGIEPVSIDLDKPFYTYHYNSSELITTSSGLDSSSEDISASSSVETSGSSSSPNPSNCPTCGLRD